MNIVCLLCCIFHVDNSVVHVAQELEQLKCDLEKFRELLLPLNKVFEWEQNYYAAVVVGVITVIFA